MSNDHSHQHGHQHNDSCCSHHHAAESCCRSDEVCDSHNHHECCDHHEHDDFYSQLIEMADTAWMEALKCKIKEQINATSGPHLEELAKIVSDSNHCRWNHKLAARKGVNEFRNKVREFFNRDTQEKQKGQYGQ